MVILTKVQEFVKIYQKDIVLVIGVILISFISFSTGYFISFSTGYLIAKDQLKGPIQVQEDFKND